MAKLCFVLFLVLGLAAVARGQGAGGFDLGDHREGQNYGNLSPMQIGGIVVIVGACIVATMVTGCFCYNTYKKHTEEERIAYSNELHQKRPMHYARA